MNINYKFSTMRITHISDSHSNHDKVIIEKTDILIHSGDITYFSKKGMQEVVNFLDWFYKQDAKYKIFIGGNHDIDLEKEEAFFRSVMPPGVIYLNDESVDIEGIKIWGSPYTPRFYDWAFNVDRGEAIQKHWDKIPEGTNIVVTHGPPMGVLDNDIGCRDLLNTIYKIKPDVCLFGHCHVGYGHEVRDVNGKRMDFYNSALVGDNYKIKNKPHDFELVV